jgi:hypothetical protein
LLDDFEAGPHGWDYAGGQEFPDAKGSLVRDVSVAHGGRGSYWLQEDFAGGAYADVWRSFTPVGQCALEVSQAGP